MKRHLLAILAAILACLTVAVPAVAYADGPSATTSTGGPCVSSTDGYNGILPVTRWADGSGTFLWNDKGGISGLLAKLGPHTGSNIGASMSSAVWLANAQFTETSLQLCPLQTVGGAVDHGLAVLGTAVTTSPVVLILFLGCAVMLIVRKARGNGKWSDILQVIVGIVLLVAMTAGASASTGGGFNNQTSSATAPYSDPNAAYKPGVGSPGWIVTETQNGATWVAGMIGDAIGDSLDALAPIGPGGQSSDDPMSCTNYLKSLDSRYTAYWNGADNQTAVKGAGAAWSLSNLYLRSQVQAWKTVQFGPENIDPNHPEYDYPEFTWCRLLDSYVDDNADGFAPSITYPQDGQTRVGGVTTDAMAFSHITDDNQRYAYTILWATCAPDDPTDLGASGYTWRSTSLLPEAAKNVDATKECQRFFNDPSYDYESWQRFIPKWDDLNSQLDKDADGHGLPENNTVLSFLTHLRDAGGATSDTQTVVGAAIGSWLCLAAFGILSLGVIVGKLMLVICVVTVLLELIIGMVKQETFPTIARWLKRMAGIAFFTSISLVIFSLVSLFSAIVLMTAGAIVGGIGGFVYSLIVGLAPVFGLGILIWAVKKAGLPNPLSIKGALSYAKGAEGVGSSMQPSQSKTGRSILSKLGLGGGAAVAAKKLLGGKRSSTTNAQKGVKDKAMADATQTRQDREQQLIDTGAGPSTGKAAKDYWDKLSPQEKESRLKKEHESDAMLKRAGTWRDPAGQGGIRRTLAATGAAAGRKLRQTGVGQRLIAGKNTLTGSAPVSTMLNVAHHARMAALAARYGDRARAAAWADNNQATLDKTRIGQATDLAYREQIARDQAHSHYMQHPERFDPPEAPQPPAPPQPEPQWPEDSGWTDEARDEYGAGL